jgi:hypothetical protein
VKNGGAAARTGKSASSGQRNHAEAQQTCLAQFARDVPYGLEARDDDAVFRLKLRFDGVFAFARGMGDFTQSTVLAKRRALERQIGDTLQTPTNRRFASRTPRQDRAGA